MRAPANARHRAAWFSGRRLTVASAAAGALGVALVTLSQNVSFEWTRIIGALLVSISGIGLGVRFGFREPFRPLFVAGLRRWRPLIAASMTVLLVAPVAAGLVAVLAGMIVGAGDERGWLLALGGLLGAVMLGGTLATGWAAGRAVLGAGGDAVTNAHTAFENEADDR